MRKLWQTLLISLFLGLGSLYLILPETFQWETVRTLAVLGLPQLTLLVGVLALRWLVGGWRTALLVRLSGASLSLWQGVRAHVVGLFASVITPAGGGNALGLTWLLTRYSVPLQNAVITSVLVTVLDMAFFAWSVPAAFLYLTEGRHVAPSSRARLAGGALLGHRICAELSFDLSFAAFHQGRSRSVSAAWAAPLR